MGKHGLSRPAPRRPVKQAPRAHDCWEEDLLSGTLVLRLETEEGGYVSPGTGRLVLRGQAGAEQVAQAAARRSGVPVLPGSGIKGAVRTVYELLSWSCDPFSGAHCTPVLVCDACSLFGCAGLSARLSFDDAVPAGDDAVEVELRQVPLAWEPHGEKTGGSFRFYDRERAMDEDPKTGDRKPRSEDVTREVYIGAFETRMRFENATPEELGRVLLAMGMGTEPKHSFALRLGGLKFHGQGAVRVSPVSACLAGLPSSSSPPAPEAVWLQWIEAASGAEWAKSFLPKLAELASALEAKGATRSGRA